MPSASAKLEKQTSFEVPDPMKQVLNAVEKKIRNLEKRKSKLDTYKSEVSQGRELNEDQKLAIEKYDEVLHTLDFSKDLQKTFVTIFQDSAKLLKKQAKREQAEKQVQEQERMKDLLIIQDVLNNMGLEHVRSCFLSGSHGAPLLTQDNLTQLDELYKLISPSREVDDAPYDDQVAKSAEHLTALLDGKAKDVANSNYKDLKELILKINESGFLGSAFALKRTEVNGERESEEETGSKGDFADETEEDYVEAEATSDVVSSQAGAAATTTTTHESDAPTQHPQESTSNMDTYFPASYQSLPTHSEGINPVPGNLNFLQESQIELESPHMDPAVVVAHPMTPATNLSYAAQGDGIGNAPSTYPGGHQLVNQQSSGQTQQQQSQYNQTQPSQQQQLIASQIGQPDYNQPIPTQTFTNQNYVGLPAMYHGQMESDLNLAHLQQQQLSVPVSSEMSNSSSGEPNSAMLAIQEPKKQYTMNVNAAAFESSVNTADQHHPTSTSGPLPVMVAPMMNPPNSYSELPERQTPTQETQTSEIKLNGLSAPGGYPHPNLSQQAHAFQQRAGSFGGNGSRGSRDNRSGGRGHRGQANGYNSNRGGRGGNGYNAGRGGFSNYRDQPTPNANNYFQNSYQQQRDNSGNNGGGFGGNNFPNGGVGGGSYNKRGGPPNTRGGRNNDGNMRANQGGNRGSASLRGGNMRGGSRLGYPAKGNQS